MRLPVDTSAAGFVTAGPAEPAIDFDTKVQKIDEDGQPVFNVHLFSIGAGGRDVIIVKVPGEPKGLGQFTPVRPSTGNLAGCATRSTDEHGPERPIR